MKYLQILLVFFALMSIAPIVANGQATRQAEIRRIDALVKKIEAITDSDAKADLVFADVADYYASAAKWQKFDSSDALEKFREKTETYTIAYNWTQQGRIVASNFTLFSPSGDWAEYVYHFFRSDGTLAKVTTELRTFEGDYIIIRDRYFDKRGRQLRSRVKYLDLATKKPKKPTNDLLNDQAGSYKVGYFRSTGKLPFAKLLTSK